MYLQYLILSFPFVIFLLYEKGFCFSAVLSQHDNERVRLSGRMKKQMQLDSPHECFLWACLKCNISPVQHSQSEQTTIRLVRLVLICHSVAQVWKKNKPNVFAEFLLYLSCYLSVCLDACLVNMQW